MSENKYPIGGYTPGEIKYNPCGGCGATDPIERCIGCFHPFYQIEIPAFGKWVNLEKYYTEDWELMHCRFVTDKVKFDTDLFEEKDHGLVKKGGTGRVEFHEVEYYIESSEQPKPVGAVWIRANEFKYEIGMPYHAKDSKSKGAGSFDSFGNFFWGDHSFTPGDNQDDLYILDESGAANNEQITAALRKFISMHEAGLLPNRFTYEEGKKALEGMVAGNDAIEFAEWAVLKCWFDEGTRLWETFDESADPFRFTTKELYNYWQQSKNKI